MSLEDLYRFGKLKKHKTNPEEVGDRFDVIKRCLKDAAQTNISLDLRFISTYQAALAAAECLLACRGYKAPRESYHYMTWEALRNMEDSYIKGIIMLFDDARQKRGNAFYDHTDVVSEAEFNELLKETRSFVVYVKGKLEKEFSKYCKNI
ncbi:MAG: SAV_6107 family HEPN domain-containing protein [Candidatus Omnitrophota bacterium]